MRGELKVTLLVTAGLTFCGCENLPQDVFGDIGGKVFGDVVGSAASQASVKMIRDTADSMCSSTNEMCRNLTMVAMTGFTESFLEQMTQSDVREINDARERSITTGEDQSWKNPETGASGSVSSVPADPRPPAPIPVTVKKDRLESLPRMEAVGEPFVVLSNAGANVRGGPGTAYAVVDRLGGAERVQAIGKVQDDDWYLVGRDNVGIGYVFGELLQKWVPPQGEVLDDALQADAAPAQQDVAQVDIEMSSECFTTTQKVTLADGATEEAEVTSCRTPDGWVTV